MPSDFGQAEDLIRRLPLPKLYRHATNAESALDQHQAAYFLWEAAAVVSDGELRVIGGEKCLSYPENIRSARREIRHSTQQQDGIVGLRPVRTILDVATHSPNRGPVQPISN